MAITSSKHAVTARPVAILAHLLGMVEIILVLVWVLHFEGGLEFKSENKKKILNVSIYIHIYVDGVIYSDHKILFPRANRSREGSKIISFCLNQILLT